MGGGGGSNTASRTPSQADGDDDDGGAEPERSLTERVADGVMDSMPVATISGFDARNGDRNSRVSNVVSFLGALGGGHQAAFMFDPTDREKKGDAKDMRQSRASQARTSRLSRISHARQSNASNMTASGGRARAESGGRVRANSAQPLGSLSEESSRANRVESHEAPT